MLYLIFFVFFTQKTAYEMRISDCSSDVCSSDLRTPPPKIASAEPCPRHSLFRTAQHRGGTPHARPKPGDTDHRLSVAHAAVFRPGKAARKAGRARHRSQPRARRACGGDDIGGPRTRRGECHAAAARARANPTPP